MTRKRTAFLKDDRAQALTEFVVVIPVVLLMFFAAMQTAVIAQCSQQVNYAAFIAARSYATSYSQFKKEANNDADKAHKDAEKRARHAATFVMAPVSHAQAGEGLPLWNPIRSVFASLPETVENVYFLLEGYAVAYVYRIKGFSITKPSSDTSHQGILHASFDYLCPIAMPGLAEMWQYFYVKRPDQTGTLDQRYDLGAPIVDLQELSGTFNQIQGLLTFIGNWVPSFHSFNMSLNDMRRLLHDSVPFLGAPINIRVTGKCAMGFEPWSGVARLKGGEDGYEVDPQLQECVDQMNQMQEDINDQQETTDDVCNEARDKETEYDSAVSAYDACRNNPNHANHPNCTPQANARDSAYSSWQSKKADCEDEGDILGEMNNDAAEFDCGF